MAFSDNSAWRMDICWGKTLPPHLHLHIVLVHACLHTCMQTSVAPRDQASAARREISSNGTM